MIDIRTERMSDVFTKFHIEGLPVAAVLHRFTSPDDGDFHDHPFGFTSFIISGGYVEECVGWPQGYWGKRERKPGDSFYVSPTTIHRIIALPEGECWTLILPGPWERKSGFWQFREDGAYFRMWDSGEWTKRG